MPSIVGIWLITVWYAAPHVNPFTIASDKYFVTTPTWKMLNKTWMMPTQSVSAIEIFTLAFSGSSSKKLDESTVRLDEIDGAYRSPSYFFTDARVIMLMIAKVPWKASKIFSVNIAFWGPVKLNIITAVIYPLKCVEKCRLNNKVLFEKMSHKVHL